MAFEESTKNTKCQLQLLSSWGALAMGTVTHFNKDVSTAKAG
jgi:hypothetical protein